MQVYKEANGSLTLELRDNLVFATFSGAITAEIMAYFINGIADVVKPLQGAPWGYISDSRTVEAATPDSEDNLFKAAVKSVSLGCVAGTYVTSSIVMIDQMDKVLKRNGMPEGIEGRVYSTLEDAQEHCLRELKRFNDSHS